MSVLRASLLLALVVLAACAHVPRGPEVVVDGARLGTSRAEACDRIAPLAVASPDEAAAAAGMLPGDWQALRATAQVQRATVTFRDSNLACGPHLAAGVQSKPHDILQKTWEAKNLRPEDQHLAGLVSDLFKKPPAGVVVDAPKLTLKGGEPVTCDYDLMDLLEDDGSRVPGESPRDLSLRAALNASLPETARGKRDRIMHGAQTSYGDYLRLHPEEAELVVLYKPEAPLTAFGSDGRAFRLPTAEDALNFYRCRGVTIPEKWNVSARGADGATAPVR